MRRHSHRRASIRQFVSSAAPASGRFFQHTLFQQLRDIAQRSVGRTLADGRPLAAGEFALETVEQAVEQFHLPFVQWSPLLNKRPALPEARLDQYLIQRGLRAGDGAPECTEEP